MAFDGVIGRLRVRTWGLGFGATCSGLRLRVS